LINKHSHLDLLWLWEPVALGGRLSVEPQALGHLHPHLEWPDVLALLVDAGHPAVFTFPLSSVIVVIAAGVGLFALLSITLDLSHLTVVLRCF